jgi:hypothetical protein
MFAREVVFPGEVVEATAYTIVIGLVVSPDVTMLPLAS